MSTSVSSGVKKRGGTSRTAADQLANETLHWSGHDGGEAKDLCDRWVRCLGSTRIGLKWESWIARAQRGVRNSSLRTKLAGDRPAMRHKEGRRGVFVGDGRRAGSVAGRGAAAPVPVSARSCTSSWVRRRRARRLGGVHASRRRGRELRRSRCRTCRASCPLRPRSPWSWGLYDSASSVVWRPCDRGSSTKPHLGFTSSK